MKERIVEIYKYNNLLINLTVKELKLKYKNSALGFLWSFLNPLMMMLVYSFAFKFVMRIPTENFTVFILTGILPWGFFQGSIQGSTGSIVGNSNLVKKIYFPREIIPLSNILANFINLLITFIVVFISLVIFKIKVGVSIILLPLVLILMLIFTIGLSLILSAMNVIYRDVAHFVEVVFMAWFYVTPIVYSLDLIPIQYRKYFFLNPMTSIIECIRSTVIYNRLPGILTLLGILLCDTLFMIVGYSVFKNIEKRFAEEI